MSYIVGADNGWITPLQSLIWPEGHRFDHAPSLGAGGYLLSARPTQALLRVPWMRGMERLAERDAFPSDRQSFAHRPVELLGIALGVAACRDDKPELVTWLASVIQRAYRDHTADAWANGLEVAAELVLRSRTTLPSTPEHGNAHAMAAWRWASSLGQGPVDMSDLDRRILAAATLDPLPALTPAESAVLYRELKAVTEEAIESAVERRWQVSRPERDAVALVRNLCRHFHLFAQQLLARHDGRETIRIADEYDVQDIMHALLKLHFVDVREEEPAPSVGGKSSRMDFLLKRERVIVETKMTRKNLRQKELSDQLIIDMTRYRSHPDCGTVVCFVYDPGGYCHAPAALEADLSTEADGFRTVVVVCPSGR